jgi:hypothetical protein
MRLDEEKLEALRSWGDRLREAGGEESAAVGRAILMLVEEIDRLHIELWHARIQPSDEPAVTTDEKGEPAEEDEAPVASGLHARLKRLLRSDTADEPDEPAAEPVAEAETDGAAAAQAWIAAMRREE